jgi:hypothetical protein
MLTMVMVMGRILLKVNGLKFNLDDGWRLVNLVVRWMRWLFVEEVFNLKRLERRGVTRNESD